MAIMGRRKMMVKNIINNRKKNEVKVETKEENVSEEEHQRRMNILKEQGLI